MIAPPKTTGAAPKKPVSQLPLADVEQRLDTTQAEIATLRTELGELDATLRTMAARPTAAREEQSQRETTARRAGVSAARGEPR